MTPTSTPTTFSVVINGRTLTRTSKTKTYTHCVAFQYRTHSGFSDWQALAWAGSLELATKRLATAQRELAHFGYCNTPLGVMGVSGGFQIVPVKPL